MRYAPQRVEVIHLASRTVTNSIPVEGLEFLSYSPSGNFLVGGGPGKVIRWDTRTWEAREAVALKFPLVFSHRTAEELFVACHTNDHLEVWSPTTWQKIAELTNAPTAGPLLEPSFPANADSIGALAISSGDDIVYRAGARGIRRWDLRQRNEIAPFAIPGMDLVATSEAGHFAAAEHTGKVHLINPELGEISYTFTSHLAWISALKFSRDGRRLVSASADRKIVVHHPGNRRDVRQLLGHETEVWALDLSADGETIVSGAGGGHVLTWSLADTAGGGLNLAEAKRCAVLDDGRILIHSASAKDLEYYDPVKGTVEPARAQRFVPASTKMDVDLLEVSPNAKWAVFAEGSALVVWNVLAGGREGTLSHQSGKAHWAEFSPDSRFVLTTGNDSEVRLWRTDHWTSDTLCQKLPKLDAIGFSGNSQRVAIAGASRFIKVFDLARELREILLEQEKDDSWPSYYCVAVSKSGRWLAAGGQDNVVRIWNLETGKRAAILQGHVQGVWSVNFSTDDRTLASSCVGRLMLWQVGSWQELLSINEPITRIEFSPNGRYLVGWERSDQVATGTFLPRRLESPRIWPAPTLAELDAETAHGQPTTERR
jgi:WD40 repeat protein